MAARTVHCYFKNLTDQTISLVNFGIDYGIYTDPWLPPQTIPPGGVGEWRTESDLFPFAGGVEGKATYKIASGTGPNMGTEHIVLWWDNPISGGNQSRISITKEFGEPSEVFEGANRIDGSPPPNLAKMADGDVEAWIDAVLVGPPYIFANASSANDANAVFAIRRKGQGSSPLFGPQGTGTQSSKINTSQKVGEWEGFWSSNAVSVTITSLGGGSMSASILDTTDNPPIHLQETFTLGQISWAFNAYSLAVQDEFMNSGPAATSAIIRASTRVIRPFQEAKHEYPDAGIHKIFREALDEEGFTIPETRLVRVSKAASAITKLSRSTVMLSHGICLTLYDDFEDGQRVDNHMLYERIVLGSITSKPLASERLRFYPILR